MKLSNVKLIVFLIPFLITASHNSQSAPYRRSFHRPGLPKLLRSQNMYMQRCYFFSSPRQLVRLIIVLSRAIPTYLRFKFHEIWRYTLMGMHCLSRGLRSVTSSHRGKRRFVTAVICIFSNYQEGMAPNPTGYASTSTQEVSFEKRYSARSPLAGLFLRLAILIAPYSNHCLNT